MTSPQPSVKEQMVQIIQTQPDGSFFDEILRELAFARMIERGLADVDQGRTVEVRREVVEAANSTALAAGALSEHPRVSS